MLRLGHKYDFVALQETALSYFSQQFPEEEEDFIYTDPPMQRLDVDTRCYLDGDHSFNDVVNLAVDLKLNLALPAVFLHALILAESAVSPDVTFSWNTRSDEKNIVLLVRLHQKYLRQYRRPLL
jgi:hypothetical protein